MTHDFDGFTDEPRFERFTPTLDAAPPEHGALDGLDPSFVFDFQAYDDLESDTQRWSTWLSVEPLCRGPEPRPDWVVTDRARSTPTSASSRPARRPTSSCSSAPSPAGRPW